MNYSPCQLELSVQNMSILKSGKAKAIRFSTLAKICELLNCQPGDILKYSPDEAVDSSEPE